MGELYDKAISFDSLFIAMEKCAKNVRWKDSVSGYLSNGLFNTFKLRRSLLLGKYKIDPYQRFYVFEPKKREIVSTRFKDRQFQRAVTDGVLYEQMTSGFIRDNCACLRHRGVDDALNRMNCHLQRFYRERRSAAGVRNEKHQGAFVADGWVLSLDIKGYFPNTPHEVACEAISRRVVDKEAAEKACEIVNSFDGDKGIGLGSQVSQLVELAVLDNLDHFIKERLRIKHYIRYMDDMVLIHEDRAYLRYCWKEIEKKINEIGLQLNRKSELYQLSQGIKFLKWRFILTDSGKVIRRMSNANVNKERRRLRKLKNLVECGRLSMNDAECQYQSWRANAERGSTNGLVKSMDSYYRKLFGEMRSAKGNNGGSGCNESRLHNGQGKNQDAGDGDQSASQ